MSNDSRIIDGIKLLLKSNKDLDKLDMSNYGIVIILSNRPIWFGYYPDMWMVIEFKVKYRDNQAGEEQNYWSGI